MPLQTKVGAAFLILFSIMLLHGISTLVGQRRLIQEETEQRGRVLAVTLSEMSVDPLLSGHFERLERQVDSIVAFPDVLYARVVNRNGRIVADTDRSNQGWLLTVFIGESTMLRTRNDRNSLNIIAPILVGNTYLGYVEVELSLVPLNDRLRRTSLVFLVALSAQVFVAIGFGLYIHFQAILPLKLISNALVSNKTEPIFEISHLKTAIAREIKTVASAIDSMRTRLEKYYREERDIQRLRTLGEIAISMAHEIRNPLEAVSGAVEIIRRSPVKDPENLRFLEIIQEEVNVLNRYVSEFAQYGRFDLGADTIFDLNELISGTLVILAPYAQQQGIKLQSDVHNSRLMVSASKSRIKRVVVNVVMNAIEACSHSDTIMLKTCFEKDFAVVIVENNGPPIPEKIMAHIFDPFISSKAHGLGLGLALCNNIIEECQGTISIENLDSSGVRVTIEIPSHKESLHYKGPQWQKIH